MSCTNTLISELEKPHTKYKAEMYYDYGISSVLNQAHHHYLRHQMQFYFLWLFYLLVVSESNLSISAITVCVLGRNLASLFVIFTIKSLSPWNFWLKISGN